MPQERIFWKDKASTKLYHREVSQKASGVVDEKYIEGYISAAGDVVVVDLGIGDGRELNWLSNIKNIQKILGVDYSSEFLALCKETVKKYGIKIDLIKDNFLSLNKLKKHIQNEQLPVIYICLINSLGNFQKRKREKIVTNIKNLMNEKDRLILCLYKRPESISAEVSLPPHINVRNGKVKIAETIEYASLKLFWAPILKKYRMPPRFWYNEKTNDIAVYADGKKIFMSHRFS